MFNRFKKKSAEVKPPEWVKVTETINTTKSFCTIRTKKGEDILSKVFYSQSGPSEFNECGYWLYDSLQVMLDFFRRIGTSDQLEQVSDNRMIRGTDILDIVGIVSSQHEQTVIKYVKKEEK